MRVDYYCLPEQDRVWRDINDLVLSGGLPGGSFRIHAHKPGAALSWHAWTMMPIGRAGGEDRHGLLYVGAARDFRADFITLWASLGPEHADVADHPVGQAFRSAELHRSYRQLCFTLRFSHDPDGIAAEELATYRTAFGESPPLHQLAGLRRNRLPEIA